MKEGLCFLRFVMDLLWIEDVLWLGWIKCVGSWRKSFSERFSESGEESSMDGE